MNICTAGGHQGCSLTLWTSAQSTEVSAGIWYSRTSWFESTAALHEQTPPKRITANPSLIHWSINMTSTVQCQRQVTQRTCHPEGVWSEFHAGFMSCSGFPALTSAFSFIVAHQHQKLHVYYRLQDEVSQCNG